MHSRSSLVAFVLSTNFEATMPAAEIGKVKTQKYDGGELELRFSYIYLSRDVLLPVKHSFASLSFTRIAFAGNRRVKKQRF